LFYVASVVVKASTTYMNTDLTGDLFSPSTAKVLFFKVEQQFTSITQCYQ